MNNHALGLIGETLRRWGVAEPRIAVAGLNPHAAGTEDAEEIAPAVAEARPLGFDISGPLSPGTVFGHALHGQFDVVVLRSSRSGPDRDQDDGMGRSLHGLSRPGVPTRRNTALLGLRYRGQGHRPTRDDAHGPERGREPRRRTRPLNLGILVRLENQGRLSIACSYS